VTRQHVFLSPQPRATATISRYAHTMVFLIPQPLAYVAASLAIGISDPEAEDDRNITFGSSLSSPAREYVLRLIPSDGEAVQN
jgi:hypothetical protein